MPDDLDSLARAAQASKQSRSAREAVGYPMPPRAAYPPQPPPLPNPAFAPPPVPMPAGVARVWTVHDQGRQFGPHTELELASLLGVGTVSPAALVWRDGSPRWIPITSVVPLPAYAPPPPTYQPAYHPPIQASNRIACGIVALLIGALGIHKFMYGANGAGVVMLLVSVLGACAFGIGPAVMGVIGFVEGIVYLTKTDAQFVQEYQVGKKAWF